MKTQKQIQRFRRRLLGWYDRHGRKLPWRETPDPYPIWLSEIMLQQTQVSTVIPYYQRFIKNFPTVRQLSAAPLHCVLKNWEGLGYYSRARNLHRAARIVSKNLGGGIPKNRKELEKLPGIGRSTAGAILSFSFNQREAILDGNVKRVLCRLFGIQEDPKTPAIVKRLWEHSEQILPIKRVADFNQALMDLGATVCIPKHPLCSSCPSESLCEARKQGREKTIPLRAERTKIPHRYFIVRVIQMEGKILIQQRPQHGLLGGLWEFPTFELKSKQNSKAFLSKTIKKKFGINANGHSTLNPVTHSYTHFKATYFPFLCRPSGLEKNGRGVWVPPTKIKNYPFSRVYQRIIDQYSTHLSS